MSASPRRGRLLSWSPGGRSGPSRAGGRGGLGCSFCAVRGGRGEGRGRRTRCGLGPNEGAGGGEERKGSPGGRPPAPAPPGLIGFVSGPARGCQLSPGPGARGREARAAGAGARRRCRATLPASLQLLSFFSVAQNFLGFFSLGVEIWGKFLANRRSCGGGARGRWGSRAPPWTRVVGRGEQLRLVLEARTPILAIALAPSQSKHFALWRVELCFVFLAFHVSELEVHLTV